jgi:hypothetical protein
VLFMIEIPNCLIRTEFNTTALNIRHKNVAMTLS